MDEDSVTGSAHAALTPFWAERLGRDSFTALQASQRGGDATCRLEGDRAGFGGDCVTVVEGRFYLERVKRDDIGELLRPASRRSASSVLPSRTTVSRLARARR